MTSPPRLVVMARYVLHYLVAILCWCISVVLTNIVYHFVLSAFSVKLCQRSVSTRKIDSIILLQARARGYLARSEFRKRHKSAISIQCLVVWRGFWAQLQTQLDFMDVITVQSLARRSLAVHDRDARRSAVFVLHRNARIFLATRAFNLIRVKRQQLIQRLAAAVLYQVSVPLICSLLR